MEELVTLFCSRNTQAMQGINRVYVKRESSAVNNSPWTHAPLSNLSVKFRAIVFLHKPGPLSLFLAGWSRNAC